VGINPEAPGDLRRLAEKTLGIDFPEDEEAFSEALGREVAERATFSAL
jgi:hypothetical protein